MAKWIKKGFSPKVRTNSFYTSSFLNAANPSQVQLPRTIGEAHSSHGRSLYLEARSKYHLHCMEWNFKAASAFDQFMGFPFLDPDLIQFLISIPGEVQNKNGVPRSILRESMKSVLPSSIYGRNWKADFSEVVNENVSHDLEVIKKELLGNPYVNQVNIVDMAMLIDQH